MTQVEGCQGSVLGYRERERMHKGRAGEGSGESHWLQMQILDEHTASLHMLQGASTAVSHGPSQC